MPLHFRQATPADLPDLLDHENRSNRILGRAFYPNGEMDRALRYMTMIDEALLDEEHYFLWEEDGRIAASGGWSRAVPGYAAVHPDAVAPEDARTAIVRSVFVAPERARQGLGRRVMAHIEADAARAGIARLTLTATLPGEALYRALGYDDNGPAEAVLPDGTRIALREMSRRIGAAAPDFHRAA